MIWYDIKNIHSKSIYLYCRLTGTYGFVIFFVATVFRYMEYGPVNIQTLMSTPKCRENSWYNLLYINNFQSLPEMCLPVTWYLANDMQFFIITPPIVFILWKFRTVGFAICGKYKILHKKILFWYSKTQPFIKELFYNIPCRSINCNILNSSNCTNIYSWLGSKSRNYWYNNWSLRSRLLGIHGIWVWQTLE